MYSNKLICDILIYIDININFKITIEDLEKRFFYNRYYIMKLFKKELNMTIVDYINSIRIYNSLLQMRDTDDKILYIALKNGFYSIEYFSETFKKIVGVKPNIAKKYFKYKKNISIIEEDAINKAFVSLYYIKLKKEKYIARQRPIKLPVKKRSIFG